MLTIALLAGACSGSSGATDSSQQRVEPTVEPTAAVSDDATTDAVPNAALDETPAPAETAPTATPPDDSATSDPETGAVEASGGDGPEGFTTRPLGIGPLGIKNDWSKLGVDGPYLDTLGSFGGFFEISWCRIEEEEGEQDWRRLDRVVSDAEEHDIELLVKIRVGSCWATDGAVGDARGERDRRPSALPADMEQYDAFVTQLVTRYIDTSVIAYAIENEVNGPNFWGGTVEEFVQVSEAGARAVRAADPSVFLMDSGLSSTTYGAAIAADLLDRGQDDVAVDVYNAYYLRRTRRGRDFPPVSSPDELRAVLDDGQAARNISYARASLDLAERGIVDAYQLHFYERFNSIPALMDYVTKSAGDAPIYVVEAGIFWEGADETALLAETALMVTGLIEHGAASVTFLPLRSNGEGIRWGLLDPEGDPPPRALLFAQINGALQGANPRVGVLDLDGTTAVILGSDDGAVAILKDAQGESLDFEVVEGETPELLAAQLS